MPILLIVIALAVVAGVAAFATGAGGRMADAPPDLEPSDLPEDRWVQSPDLDRTRFSLGVRGYRMEQVDAVLDRVSSDLVQRDGYIDDLTAALVQARIDVPPMPAPILPDAVAMEGDDGLDDVDADTEPDLIDGPDAADEAPQGSEADAVGDPRG